MDLCSVHLMTELNLIKENLPFVERSAPMAFALIFCSVPIRVWFRSLLNEPNQMGLTKTNGRDGNKTRADTRAANAESEFNLNWLGVTRRNFAGERPALLFIGFHFCENLKKGKLPRRKPTNFGCAIVNPLTEWHQQHQHEFYSIMANAYD